MFNEINDGGKERTGRKTAFGNSESKTAIRAEKRVIVATCSNFLKRRYSVYDKEIINIIHLF